MSQKEEDFRMLAARIERTEKALNDLLNIFLKPAGVVTPAGGLGTGTRRKIEEIIEELKKPL